MIAGAWALETPRSSSVSSSSVGTIRAKASEASPPCSRTARQSKSRTLRESLGEAEHVGQSGLIVLDGCDQQDPVIADRLAGERLGIVAYSPRQIVEAQ